MPIQIIPRVPSTGDYFAEAIGAAAGAGVNQMMGMQQKKTANEQMQKENAAIKKQLGIDLSGIKDPESRKAIISEQLKSQGKEKLLQQRTQLLNQFLNPDSQGFGDQIMGQQNVPQGIFKPEFEDQMQPSPQSQSQPKKKYDASEIPDEMIFKIGTIDQELGREVRAAKDSALKQRNQEINLQESQRKSSPEYLREQELNKGQAQADQKFYNDLQERRSKQVLKKESLNRLEKFNKRKVTGKAYEKFLENMGLTALTSEGRRELSAEVKNQFTDFKAIAGSQLSAQEFFVLSGAYPNADFSPEANERIIENLQDVHDTLDKEYEIALRLRKDNGGKLPPNYQEKVNTELQEYSNRKMQRMKDNIKFIQNEQYGIPKGYTLMFDNDGEPLSVPEDKIEELIQSGLADLP